MTDPLSSEELLKVPWWRGKRIAWDFPAVLEWERDDNDGNPLSYQAWTIRGVGIVINVTELAIWGFRAGRSWRFRDGAFWPGYSISLGWIYVLATGWAAPVQEIR